MIPTEHQLSEVLSEFARTMVADFPIESILDHLVQRIVEILPIDAAGVTLISPAAQPHYIAASDDSALRYEQLQTEMAEGPCILAYRSGGPISVPDLRTDERFPNFGPRAFNAGLKAVFTLPLRHGADQLGALDLYSESAGDMSPTMMKAAQTLADVVAAYLLNAQARDDLKESSNRSRQAALHDPLTGLPNRVLLLERMEHGLLRSRRSGRAAAVFYIDLDRFKAVNDAHGHRTGDELLVAVASRLTAALRPHDTLARLAGDEFVVLCDDLDNHGQAVSIGARLNDILARPFVLSASHIEIGGSIGIAFARDGRHTPEQILHDADLAMYQAKSSGGGRSHALHPDSGLRVDYESVLTHDLQQAIAGNQLGMEYQPTYRTGSKHASGFEGFLRWTHSTHGIVPPLALIALAERAKMIMDVGEWVLERAMADRARWGARNNSPAPALSINVSSYQLLSPGFTAMVANNVIGTTAAPEQLTLEVTEGALISDGDRAGLVLRDLKTLGINIALDNFTGSTAFNHLQRFPLDTVKLDRTLVTGLRSADDQVLPDAIVSFAHRLGLTVVACGVETADQLDAVTAIGCDHHQGFYSGAPIGSTAVEELLDS